MFLYIDGALAASRTDAVYAQIINSGYWRIGGDTTSNWRGSGSSGYFAGDLDNVAVYHHPLTAGPGRRPLRRAHRGRCRTSRRPPPSPPPATS